MNKSHKRRNATAKLIIAAILVLHLLASFFVLSHLTYYKYNDWWIIGNSASNVKEKYGEFDIETSGRVGYYIYTDNYGIFSNHLKHYYYMYCDGGGKVYKVETGCQPGG